MADIAELEKELAELVSRRDRSVGMDFKRTNFKIAELQSKIRAAEESL